MHVYLVDPTTFQLQGTLDESYERLEITRRLWGVDTFSMRVHRRRLYADQIAVGMILWMAHEDDAAFLVEQIVGEQTGSTKNDWMTVSGRSLDGFATSERRIIPPAGEAYDRHLSVDAETAMKAYVYDHAGLGADVARRIPGLTVAPDMGRGTTLTTEYRYQTVTDALREIGLVGGLGWHSHFLYDAATPANSDIEFEVIAGVDRSASVFFDFEFATLEEWHEMERILDSKTWAIIAGQGEGVDREIVTRYVGGSEPAGWARREAFIDARDVELGNTTLLQQRGDAFLEAASPERSLEAKAHQYGAFRYRDHWDLGDIVLVRNKPRNLSYAARIVEVKKSVAQAGAENVVAVLDRPFPTLKEKVGASSSAGAGSIIVDYPTGGGGGGSGNIDGGDPDEIYGGTTPIDGGTP